MRVFINASHQKSLPISARMSAANPLIFQFPPWWIGLPAILKGWVDRHYTSEGAASLPGMNL